MSDDGQISYFYACRARIAAYPVIVAYSAAFDIFMVFQNLGLVLAPYGIAYSTHGRQHNPETDNDFFRGDDLMQT